MASLTQISDALQQGKAQDVVSLVQAAIAEGTPPAEILQGLIAGMSVVGDKFKRSEIYVPEVLIAARAMQAGLGVLEPRLVAAGVKPVAEVLLGTVKGDLHDIGKNLVSMMLRGAGIKVHDLGIDVSPERFLAEYRDRKGSGLRLVAMSALLTTTMQMMKRTIDLFAREGERDGALFLIGGAPVTRAYADEIGADGYAPDAASAVDAAKRLLGIA